MSDTTITPAQPEQTKSRRWDPYDLWTQAQSELEHFWGGRWPPFRPLRRLADLPSPWSPRVDVYRRNDTLVVTAELPGMTKDDIEIALEDGDLVVRGERTAEETVEEQDYYRMERSSGSFYRRLPLPDGAIQDKIEATFADGVLEVIVPMAESTKPESTKIAIK